MPSLRVVTVGLGPIGREAARVALETGFLEIVGAADLDPALAGRDLGRVLGLAEPAGVVVEPAAGPVLERLRPDAVLLCTGSRLADVGCSVLEAAALGVDVVSSAEELACPDLDGLGRALHEAALAGGATVVGAGVNPGFVLDLLPVVLSGACARVDSVSALRVLDAGLRRLPLLRKIGAGLEPGEFRRRAESGDLGHVGLGASIRLLCRGTGLVVDTVREEIEPVLAAEEVRTRHGEAIPPGRVAGLRQRALGLRQGEVVVDLDLRMYVGAPDPRDEVRLRGVPDVRFRIDGGLPGDLATGALLVHTVPRAVEAGPGWKSVLDLPPARSGPR